MKKKIFSITFVWIAITCSFSAFGQCDNPPMCGMNELIFTPLPNAIMPLPTFNLDCNATTIEADFDVSGAGNINYTWYDSGGTLVSNDDELTAPSPENYTLEVEYMSQGNQFCCAQEIIVNPWRAEDVNFIFNTQGPNPMQLTQICIGESVNLLSVPNTYCPSSYVWTFPGGSPMTTEFAGIPFTPTMTGLNTVSLQVTDGLGNTATASASLMVNDLPQLTVNTTPPIICAGSEVIVSAVVPPPLSNYTYIWNTGQTTSDFADAPTQNTTYEVEVTDMMSGCKEVNSATVQVNPSPNATIIGGDQSICAGDNISLMTTQNGATYSWSNGDTGQSTTTITPTETDSYSVTVTQGGCSSSDTITVTVIPAENFTITGDSEICTGESTTLTAPEAGMYIWSNGETDQSITISPTMNENYSVTITNGDCISTGSISITIAPSPTATIIGNTEICEGESTTLTASGGGSYLWSTGETAPSIMVSPISNESYAVTVTGVNDCTNTEAQTVMVTSVNLSINGNTTICQGESTMLTATATAGATYEWSTGETTQFITVNPLMATTYSVTKTINNCSLTEDVTVNVNPTYEMDISETICPGDSYTIGGNDYTIPDDYIIALNTFKGCDSIINLSLMVQPIPSFQFLQDSLFGNICSPQTITVDVQDELYDFTWRAADSDDVIIGDGCTALDIKDDPATFFLDVSANNCTETNTFSINLSAVALDAKVFQFANTKTLFCNRNDFDSYQWGKEYQDTLCDIIMVGETFQDVAIPDLDMDKYYYWVKVTKDDCETKIYLEGDNNSPFGKLNQDPDIEYGDLALQINPNPNEGAFELTITGDEVRDLDVHVYDALGRAIYQQKAPKIYGVHTHYIAVPNLTQGMYFVRVTGNDGILLSEKMIVK